MKDKLTFRELGYIIIIEECEKYYKCFIKSMNPNKSFKVTIPDHKYGYGIVSKCLLKEWIDEADKILDTESNYPKFTSSCSSKKVKKTSCDNSKSDRSINSNNSGSRSSSDSFYSDASSITNTMVYYSLM